VPTSFDRAFAIGTGLNVAFVAAEVFYGLSANSLALLADAGHNLSDVLGLVLAWVAILVGRRKPTARRTDGLGHTSILASLVNAVALLLAIGGIAWEAILRLQSPQPVQSGTVMLVAAMGILINGATAALFASGRKGDINIRAAFAHMLGDAVVSLGVVVAALILRQTGWTWIDPLVSLAISVVIALGTWSIFTESFNLAVASVPENIDRDKVASYLEGLSGVSEVHDLHIWPLSTTSVALTAHLVRSSACVDDAFTAGISKELEQRFGINHATIQLETGHPDFACPLTHHAA